MDGHSARLADAEADIDNQDEQGLSLQ